MTSFYQECAKKSIGIDFDSINCYHDECNLRQRLHQQVQNDRKNEFVMKGVTMAKEIQLTQGAIALVSDEDYEWLMQWKWHSYHLNGKKYPPYACRTFQSKNLLMHRAIMGRNSPIPSGMSIDHINGNTLDNRRENLRICTHSENMRNIRSHRDSGSQFRGVSWSRRAKKWRTSLIDNGRVKYFGSYDSSVIAAVIVNDFLRVRDGAMARLNDIPIHIELLARQVPYRASRSRDAKQILAQLEHAERVEKAYSEWLIMKRVTDWQAAHAATARPSATANGSATSAEEQAA